MKCMEVQELLPVYWDLAESDERRVEADQHIQGCAICREEFNMWHESTELIRSTIFEAKRQEAELELPSTLSNQVMQRIYKEEPWRTPVTERLYDFSFSLRRKLTAAISFCLALFMFSFLYSIVTNEPVNDAASESITLGLQPVAAVASDKGSSIQAVQLTASIRPQEPFMLKDGLIQSTPDYLLVLSLLGLISTLLVMNWLGRTRT
jgi:predicted anti-sigma-YlaC factor YlaD